MVPNTVHPFFSSFVGAVEEELYKKGYKTMLCNTVADSNAEHEYLDMLKRYIVDGIITDVHNLDITEYGDIDKPIVALDRYLSKNIPIVSSDHKKGGQMAAEELIKKGCKKVLHFFEEETYDAPFHDRHKEFDRIMKEHGVEVLNVQLDLNRFDTNYYAKEVRKVFDMDFNFDGIFAGDLPAIQCIKECLKRNKKVPEDVKIISYDGTYVTDLVVPELTSIVQPIQELARESVRIMTEMLNGNMDHPIHTVLPVSLRKGETT